MLPIVVVAFVAITAVSSCSGDSYPVLDDMENLYNESCRLNSVTPDSIQRFVAKFQTYVNSNPEAQRNPDYYNILNNIESAAKTYGISITITINGAWKGDTTIYY